LARLSGAARRKLSAEKALGAGVHKSHFTTPDVRAAVQSELAEKRKMVAAQRERARSNWSFVAQPAPPTGRPHPSPDASPVNAAEIAFAKIMLAERSDEGAFGVRLLARIEAAWRAREAEREQVRASRAADDLDELTDD
jgi:hypothetical protein